jgi:hypothetical protein
VPSQSRSKNLQEAQRRGDERLAELEAERGEIVLSPFGMRCVSWSPVHDMGAQHEIEGNGRLIACMR